MIAAILKEISPGENRVAATPKTVKELIKSGLTVRVQSGAGVASFFADQDYTDAGAEVISDISTLTNDVDIILKVAPATPEEMDAFPQGSAYVSLMQTTRDIPQVRKLTDKNMTGFSMHLIPRTTLAQSMDALSSQANIAGYKSVLVGATHLPVYMPLLMTAAGTIPPAKVLILGAGVAGLQAIATAKRLGAQVEAFDVRPEVKEQVESLGAKFVEVESDSDDGVGEGGYAKETSDDYKERQQALIKAHIAKSDLVITTALIPGRPAPLLIPTDMVNGMKPGSAIMDLAAENGGNCELTQGDEVVNHNGVLIDGTINLPSTMQVHASQLYAKNVSTFVTYMMKEGELNFDLEDEIISGAMFTQEGKITHEPTREAVSNS
ncbi:MAG: Re/Si-specific NAD(P)(+) transhydrogenase subunit alpha [Candidatus Marinimicrobia bacterium]|nr:Re/Si-specific NAD(P)(+) transhydrogenase subunit alpha [Candidatus Neomarinimicrobiota bacterium]MBT4065315.1 Re/Si-specific NAD(P)(+) transhydrogenase subunit alpha [Candidatus Neomarinimicrobiota bacterium]MBT4307159.1 Re/Si-specific NAD(P)(+) transhydrogenase subunit alpha [Candidatus Neomarinimicrobiota bacterium]MBT5996605.1 Re/Si-specific NAD(P)(+) transhydrogenase subunit alpha [Candidatus Neomarinimicrobiota bacterium]MCP4931892.1 Re/Si-specific NAD(P)(+) transhydrogenase subunit al